MNYGEETNQLLLYKLQGLITSVRKANVSNHEEDAELKVYIDNFQREARELNIHDLSEFFNSKLFKSHGLIVDHNRGIIIKR